VVDQDPVVALVVQQYHHQIPYLHLFKVLLVEMVKVVAQIMVVAAAEGLVLLVIMEPQVWVVMVVMDYKY